MTLIAPHITAYLRERLPNERKASPHTCDTYAYAFQLLFQFASQRLGCSPAALQLEQIDAPLVLAFLEHPQAGRRNGPSTRNARLAAIKSFMHFLEYRVPSALEQLRQVLAIPFQKTDIRLVRHLTQAEMQAILDAPDPNTRSEEHTSELQSQSNLVCRLLLEKKKTQQHIINDSYQHS